MTDTIHQAIEAATLQILRPLARLMLNHGMAYGVFAELARRAFVEEGYRHLRRSGQRGTISAVSALTGLTRKEAKRLSEQVTDANTDAGQRYSRASRVISGWVSDPLFLDDNGEPLELPLEGEGASFGGLVKSYSGDIPVAAMLSLLQSSGTIQRRDDRVRLVERAYIPMNTPVDKINILGTDVAELINTINHNLEAAPDRRFFQRKVSNALVSTDAMDEFRRFSNAKSQELLEEYHRWLTAHEAVDAAGGSSGKSYVAVGIYYIEHSSKENPS